MPADVQSEFIPMPVDLIGNQIQQRQQSYDVTKQFINKAKDTVYGTEALEVDEEALGDIVSSYDEEISNKVQSVGGDYSQLRGFTDALGSKIKKDIQQGQLGAINKNYKKAQSHLKELNELKKDGKIREAGYNKGLASIQAFEGTQDTGSGYSSPDLYMPTNYIEIGKTADQYGTKIRDQYDSMGRKYINGQTASGLIEENLWNNPEVVENAKEEVWAMYGDLNPEEEQAALEAYMKNIADDAGAKLQYQQVMQPEGEDALTGGRTYSYDIVGDSPNAGINKLIGPENTRKIGEAEETSTFKKALAYARYAVEGIIDAPRYEEDEEGNVTRTYAMDRAQETLNSADAAAEKVIKEISNNKLVQDIAANNGIDLSNPTAETYRQLQQVMDEQYNRSSNLRVTSVENKKTMEKFNRWITKGSILSQPLVDVRTKEEIPYEEKEAMLASHINSGGDGKGSMVYSGEVMATGQPVAKGSILGLYTDPDSGELRQFAVEDNIKKGSAEHKIDRVKYAQQSGFASYTVPGIGRIQLLRQKDGTIKQYVNGKEDIYPKNHKKSGQPIIYEFSR